MAKARFSNVGRANRRLKAIPFEVKRAVQAAIDQNGAELVAAMKRAAPEDEGDLIASIHYRKRDFVSQQDQLGGVVVAGDDEVFYARMVEFGTPLQVAQPFFHPIYRAYRRRMKNRRSRAARKAIKLAVSK